MQAFTLTQGLTLFSTFPSRKAGRASGSMMMAAGAVHVAVLQFFGGRLADTDDLNVEMQGLVGERMIAVGRDHVADDRGNGEQAHASSVRA